MNKKLILAGGCFWGVEAYFKRLKGVITTRVGYTDGIAINPTYQAVCTGETGHVEACEVVFDEEILSVHKLLDHLFRIIDPMSLNQQGGDVGTQYRTGVYYQEESDHDQIQDFILHMQPHYSKPIQVEVKKETPFYDAEEYHQDYLTKNPQGYCHVNLYQIPQEDLKEEYQHKKIS